MPHNKLLMFTSPAKAGSEGQPKHSFACPLAKRYINLNNA